MRRLPAGTVTLLFTDIEGSTRLLQGRGESYATLLANHRRVLRDAFAAHDGVEVDTKGDAFFYAFASAGDAVAPPRPRRQPDRARRPLRPLLAEGHELALEDAVALVGLNGHL
jgi:class 3 adenylate cyclase